MGHQVEGVHEAAIVEDAIRHAVGVVIYFTAAERQGHAAALLLLLHTRHDSISEQNAHKSVSVLTRRASNTVNNLCFSVMSEVWTGAWWVSHLRARTLTRKPKRRPVSYFRGRYQAWLVFHSCYKGHYELSWRHEFGFKTTWVVLSFFLIFFFSRANISFMTFLNILKP